MKGCDIMKLSSKTYILAFSILVAVSAAAVFTGAYKPHKTAKIMKDGKLIRTVDLSSVTVPYTIDIDGKNTVLVEKGKISMKEAKCPDKLCVKTGCNYPIVCLPNKVVITVEE